jgi:hypothetical protein
MLVGIMALIAVAFCGIWLLIICPPSSDIGYIIHGGILFATLYAVARVFGHSDPLDTSNWGR